MFSLPVITTEISDDVTVLKPSSAVSVHVNVAWFIVCKSDVTSTSPSVNSFKMLRNAKFVFSFDWVLTIYSYSMSNLTQSCQKQEANELCNNIQQTLNIVLNKVCPEHKQTIDLMKHNDNLEST